MLKKPLNQNIAPRQEDPCYLSKKEIDYLSGQAKKDNHISFRALSDCKKNNPYLWSRLVRINSDIFAYASSSLRDNEKYIERIIDLNPDIFRYISPRLKRKRPFVKKIAVNFPKILEYIPEELSDSKGFIRDLMLLDANNFKFASERLQGEYRLAKTALGNDGSLIQFLGKGLKDNKELALDAINSYVPAYHFMGKDLRFEDKIKAVYDQENYNYLSGLNSYLKKNYQGILFDKNGYHIVDRAKIFKDRLLINEKYQTRWKQEQDFYGFNSWRLAAKNYDLQDWQKKLANYPELVKKIRRVFRVRGVDEKTISDLQLTELWQVNNGDEEMPILAMNFYLIRNIIDDDFLLSKISSTTSLTLIASAQEKLLQKVGTDDIAKKDQEKKELLWEVDIIHGLFDANIISNDNFENGHKKFIIWDLYKTDESDKSPKILFKVEDYNSEYFLLFAKQPAGNFAKIYQGGGYSAKMAINPRLYSGNAI